MSEQRLHPAEWCQKKNMTARELIDKTGLDDFRVNAVLQGRWTPSPNDRKLIAEALGVDIDEIMWGHTTVVQHVYGNGPGVDR